MPEYRIYIFKDGQIQQADTIEADDDAFAFNYASTTTGGSGFEIWRGAQMIVSLGAPFPKLEAWSRAALNKPD